MGFTPEGLLKAAAGCGVFAGLAIGLLGSKLNFDAPVAGRPATAVGVVVLELEVDPNLRSSILLWEKSSERAWIESLSFSGVAMICSTKDGSLRPLAASPMWSFHS